MSDRKKENLFANLGHLAARTAHVDAASAEAVAVEDAPSPSAPQEVTPPKPATSKKKPEPTSGKRHNPDYCQANAYVPKVVRKAVDKLLLDMDDMDYSTLVTELLKKWLKSRGISA